VRAIWASSTAVVASAFVGVLLGAYIHEWDLNQRNAGQPAAPATTVQTQISTVIVTVTEATSPAQEAVPRSPAARTTTPRQVAEVTSDDPHGPAVTSPPPATTATSPANCGPLNPLPPPSCQHPTSTRDKGPDRS
jgi:hypothetical protein